MIPAAEIHKHFSRLRDWRVLWMLRRHELPDIPEVRRALRAWSRWGLDARCRAEREGTARPPPASGRGDLPYRARRDPADEAIPKILMLLSEDLLSIMACVHAWRWTIT
jgi:hypothetical protein